MANLPRLTFNASKNYADIVAPVVTGVTSPTANGTYGTSSVIEIAVTFDKPVYVTGTPQIAVNVPYRAVNYTSGDSSTTLMFNYTVQSGDTSPDLDYVAITSLSANGGTIRSIAGVNALLTLAVPGSAGSISYSKAIVIGTSVPTFDREDSRGSILSSAGSDNHTVVTTIAVGKRAVLLIRTQESVGVSSITDSAGNTWAIDRTYNRTGQSEYVVASAHITSVLTGGSATITITWGSAAYSYKDFALWQLSGVASSGAVDSTAGSEAFGATITTTDTTIATNTCIVGFAGSSSTPTYSGSTFTVQGAAITTGDGLTLHLLRLDASSAGAKSPAGTYSGNVGWGCILVAYK